MSSVPDTAVSHSLITSGDEIGYIFLHKYFHFSCTGEQSKNSFVTRPITTSSFFSGSYVHEIGLNSLPSLADFVFYKAENIHIVGKILIESREMLSFNVLHNYNRKILIAISTELKHL